MTENELDYNFEYPFPDDNYSNEYAAKINPNLDPQIDFEYDDDELIETKSMAAISPNLADNPELSVANSKASLSVEDSSVAAEASVLYKSIYASMMHSMELADPELYALMDHSDLEDEQ